MGTLHGLRRDGNGGEVTRPKNTHSSAFVPEPPRPELDVIEESDEQTARVCRLAGWLEGRPIPASHGARADIPNREHRAAQSRRMREGTA